MLVGRVELFFCLVQPCLLLFVLRILQLLRFRLVQNVILQPVGFFRKVRVDLLSFRSVRSRGLGVLPLHGESVEHVLDFRLVGHGDSVGSYGDQLFQKAYAVWGHFRVGVFAKRVLVQDALYLSEFRPSSKLVRQFAHLVGGEYHIYQSLHIFFKVAVAYGFWGDRRDGRAVHVPQLALPAVNVGLF